MDWLSQNWVWVAIAVGFAFYFFRGRFGAYGSGLPQGMGHGGHAAGAANAPEAAVDPVGGGAVSTAQAPTSLYQGKIYYFASKENRDRFEAAPQEFAQKAAGHSVHSAEAPRERPRRHRGC